MVVRDVCPGCGAIPFKNNGHSHRGIQHHPCKACGRQFVASAADRLMADEQRTLMEHLLRERISRRGICRAVGVRLTWLLRFMVERLAACPEPFHVQIAGSPTAVVLRQLEAEADERWGFVGKRANKQWIGSAMEARTRQVIACHVGDRRRDSAKQWWAKVPWVSHAQAP